MNWHTAPPGLYHIHDGKPVPILLINEHGEGLLPGGQTTTHIYAHLPGLQIANQDAQDTTRNRNDYMALVRQAEQHGTPPCPHGDPRGTRYCANCRRTPRLP